MTLVKTARKQCGLSQEQLAEKMAVSRSAVAKWEANHGLRGQLHQSTGYLLLAAVNRENENESKEDN